MEVYVSPYMKKIDQQGVIRLWGRRKKRGGGRINRATLMNSKSHQGVRGSWGKRNYGEVYLQMGSNRLRDIVDKRGETEGRMMSIVNHSGQQRIRGLWGKRSRFKFQIKLGKFDTLQE